MPRLSTNRSCIIKSLGNEAFLKPTKGLNSRLSPIQAAVLNVKLKYLQEWNDRREKIANLYDTSISNINLTRLSIDSRCISSNHLYVVLSRKRSILQKYLSEKGIPTLIHYPIPPHRQYAYKEYNDYSLPIADLLADSVLSLPIGPHLDIKNAEKVISAINSFK